MSSSNPHAPRIPALHARIRNRRLQTGLTGTELGRRAGISTSYVSVIENGAKVPDETVAAALARALGDDEALYRAWARAARLGVHDLEALDGLARIARTPGLASRVESGDDLSARLREVASRIGPAPAAAAAEPPAEAVRVPWLDLAPDRSPVNPPGRALLLDARLFDARQLVAGGASSLFACEVSEAAAARLGGIASAGDRVVLRRGAPVRPDRVSAVRTPAGLTLARALVADGRVVVLPGAGEKEGASLALGPDGAVDPIVAGTQVLLIRG